MNRLARLTCFFVFFLLKQTVKRVVIIIASVLVFHNPVSTLGGVGSAIAILGAMLYSVAKSKCKPKPKAA